jgi:hypothetical protein
VVADSGECGCRAARPSGRSGSHTHEKNAIGSEALPASRRLPTWTEPRGSADSPHPNETPRENGPGVRLKYGVAPGRGLHRRMGWGGAGGRPLCAGLTLTGGLPRAAAKAWLMRGRTPVLRVSRLWQGSIDVVVIAVKLPDKPDSDRLPDGYSSNVASSLTPRGSLYPDRATSSPATRRFCGKERHVARSSKSRLAPRGQVQNANLSRPGRHEGIPREVRERRLRSAPAGPLYGRRSAWPVPTATSTGHHSQQIGNTCRASVRAATWPVLDPRPARNT